MSQRVAAFTDPEKAAIAEIGDQLFDLALELDDVPLNDETDLLDYATRIRSLGDQLHTLASPAEG